MGKEIDTLKKKDLQNKTKNIFNRFKKDYPDVISVPQKNSISKIESLGIFILIAAAPEKISGFCMVIGEDTFIFINKVHKLGRQNYSLWHEVYHWYTGTYGDVSSLENISNSEIEFSAEYFASLVLIDENHLKEKLKEKGYSTLNMSYLKYDHIIELQHYFHVSYSAMLTKIIEVFPEANLNNRFALSKLSKREELENRTQKLGLSLDLINHTEDTYISSTLFDWLNKVVNENRVSKKKVEKLIEFIEKELE